MYNPWSVLNYVKSILLNPDAFPKLYWVNTSSNHIVRQMVEHTDGSVKEEIEALIEGGTIEKSVYEEITYEDIYKPEDNLWNFLFLQGIKKTEEPPAASFQSPRKNYHNPGAKGGGYLCSAC